MNIEKCGYVCNFWEGVVVTRLRKKKHREQDYAISNQIWVCKFEEIG